MIAAPRNTARDPAREPSPGDPALMASVAAGEMSALGMLFDRYDQDVRRLIARLGVSPGDVDDLVQLTFLDALRSARSYDGRASARPWLMGLAVMIVRRHRRSIGRLAARLAAWATMPSEHARSPEEQSETNEAAERARRALDALSSKKREAFVLVALEGMSGEQAAELLSVPAATVGTRLHHARRELREALARDGERGAER